MLMFEFRAWQIPYFWAGIKAYDLVAGSQNLKSSYFLSRVCDAGPLLPCGCAILTPASQQRALEEFNMLRADDLKGAIVYYDGVCLWVFV
jgi:glycerol-3-phosphate dehydrogenase